MLAECVGPLAIIGAVCKAADGHKNPKVGEGRRMQRDGEEFVVDTRPSNEHIIESCLFTHPLLKVTSGALEWINTAVREFGQQAVDVKMYVELLIIFPSLTLMFALHSPVLIRCSYL